MDTKTVLKIISVPISKLPERRSRYRIPRWDDGTVHGPSFNRETENANQPFQENDGAELLHGDRRSSSDTRHQHGPLQQLAPGGALCCALQPATARSRDQRL